MTRRRAKLVLLVLGVALVGLGVLAWEPLWDWTVSKRAYFASPRGGYPVRGWHSLSRWSADRPHGRQVAWYEHNGLKAFDGSDKYDNLAMTHWNPDGTIRKQFRTHDERGEELPMSENRDSPPWLWGVTDQTEPSMPEWMNDDAKWAKALEEAGQ